MTHVGSWLLLAACLGAAAMPAHAQPAPPARRLPATTLTVPDELPAPLIVTGAYQPRTYRAAQGSFVEEQTWATADAPDFVLHLTRDYTALELHLLGDDGTLRWRSADSWLKDGAKPGSQAPSEWRRNKLDRVALTAGDWVVWLNVRARAKGTWTVAVWGDKTKLDPAQRIGEPASDAPLETRALSTFVPSLVALEKCEQQRGEMVTAARRWFASAPRSFFVFPSQPLARNRNEEAPTRGEPLLVLGGSTPRLGGGEAKLEVLSFDGLCFMVDARKLTADAPAQVALPAPRKLKIVLGKDQPGRWTDEDFLAYATPEVEAAYRAKKRAAWECFDRAWDKLDPQHNATRYDVVTTRGDKISVESLEDRISRQASATCKTDALWAHRDKVEGQVLSDLAKQRAAWRLEAEAHLGELGFPR